jgi:hypothetical protein
MADTSMGTESGGASSPKRRIAILVIHGIGEQKPYETLDHFARGLLTSLRAEKKTDWTIGPRLDACSDPLHIQKDWTRTSVRLEPAAPTNAIRDITLFEYYWAPITEDKISYAGSLQFLIATCLKPLQYLWANVDALKRANKQVGSGTEFQILAKEISRICMLFIPLAGVLGLLLVWLAKLPAYVGTLRNSSIVIVLLLGLAVIRVMYVWYLSEFLSDAFSARRGWQTNKGMIVLTIVLLLFWISMPCWLPWILGRIAEITAWKWVLAVLGKLSNRDVTHPWLDFLARFLYFDSRSTKAAWIAVVAALGYLARWILVHYVGDIAVYVNSDQRSESFAARSQILDECTQTVSGLLTRPSDSFAPHGAENFRPAFSEVILVGHSLGSVIAYDTINEILNRSRTGLVPVPEDLKRVSGMITFGSPLNKTFYFFREQVSAQQAIRKQIIALLYPFRSVVQPDVPPDEAFECHPPALWKEAEAALDSNFKWVNVWSVQDPISGKMLFYDLKGDGNQLHLFYRSLFAHNYYWDDPRFYSYFLEKFI